MTSPLPLTDLHLAELRASGLRDEIIIEEELKSSDDVAKLNRNLNRTDCKRFSPCLAYQYRNRGGKTVMVRYKPTTPRTNDKGDPIKYESPVGSENRLYVPKRVWPLLGTPEVPPILTEGEKKTLAAVQVGFATVGLAGVDCWTAPRPKRTKKGKRSERRSSCRTWLPFPGRVGKSSLFSIVTPRQSAMCSVPRAN